MERFSFLLHLFFIFSFFSPSFFFLLISIIDLQAFFFFFLLWDGLEGTSGWFKKILITGRSWIWNAWLMLSSSLHYLWTRRSIGLKLIFLIDWLMVGFLMIQSHHFNFSAQKELSEFLIGSSPWCDCHVLFSHLVCLWAGVGQDH